MINSSSWDGNHIIINIDGLAVGNYTYTCIIYDKAGNSVSDEILIIVTQEQEISEPAIPGYNYHLMIIIIIICLIALISTKKQSKLKIIK